MNLVTKSTDNNDGKNDGGCRKRSGRIAAISYIYVVLLACLALGGCYGQRGDATEIRAAIKRYNQLLIEGYRTFNMNPLQEVVTPEQATKLYYHMSAMGEGKLRMESALKEITFVKMEFAKPGEATVETKEIWDFTHFNMTTGKKYAEEKDFVYHMGYSLKKEKGRWVIYNVNTVSGESTNMVIPWPEIDRKGTMKQWPSGAGEGKPAGHP